MNAKRTNQVWDPLADSRQDKLRADRQPRTPQSMSPAYRLAYADEDFLCREELRPVRLQLELLKPEMILMEAGIRSTVVMFGGARIPEPGKEPWAAKNEIQAKNLTAAARYYNEAREFARICSNHSLTTKGQEYVICTGGGPGVMEAGNRGAHDVGAASIGLNVVLPHEQAPNEYVTPEFSLNFHYFAIRKMHFLMRAKAVTIFPGGFGTHGRAVRIPDPDPDRAHGACAVDPVRFGVLELHCRLSGAGRFRHHLSGRSRPAQFRRHRR
jgi:predicted Rossmann-fold nucleotide-binding protein